MSTIFAVYSVNLQMSSPGAYHQLNDREAIFTLMESYPLGAWVCSGKDGLVANHVPFFLDRSKGPIGTLIGHVSRANDV